MPQTRFVRDDIPVLHRHLSVRTKHLFNRANPEENGSFFNLIQHHGYPTPILDWTYSPYVAAFFAYRGISNEKARSKETAEKTYLWAIDLPVSQRREVANDLRYMGITAGTLFPGLDGMCEELKERNFEL